MTRRVGSKFDSDSIVDHFKNDVVVNDQHDDDMGGLRMLADIGKHLAQDSQQMVGCLLRDGVVDSTPKGQLGTDSERGCQLICQGDDSLADATWQSAVTEFEDRGADFGDGGIEVVHDFVDPLSHEVEIGQTGGPLQGHADSEQPLHHPVMEVTPNPLSVIEHADRPDAVVETGVVDRNTRSKSEGFSESDILVCELLRTDLVREIQVAKNQTFGPDRHSEKGSHRRVVWREPETELMCAELAQSKGCGVGDQQPENASTRWPRSDGMLLRLTQSDRQELLETCSGLVEHTEGAVAGTDEGTRLFDQMTQQDRELDISLDHEHGIHQSTQLPGVVDPVIRHTVMVLRRGPPMTGHATGR